MDLVTRKGRLFSPSHFFVLPAFLLHAVFVSIPALSMLYFALTSWTGLGKALFVGLANYKRIIFEDKIFHHALSNNVIWVLLMSTVPIFISLILALLISRLKYLQMVYKSTLFIPYVIASVVASSVWIQLYNRFFGFPKILNMLGLKSLAAINWLGSPDLVLFSISFVRMWSQWGFFIVLFTAALSQIDPSLHEAADLDGVNSFQRFFYIIIPMIRPTLSTIWMLTIIGSFLTFDYIFAMTSGGPGNASEVAATWIYKSAFQKYEVGYAMAMSICITAIAAGTYFLFHKFDKGGADS
jgi:raffinose/stachyose/melibiose transport system permease protein